MAREVKHALSPFELTERQRQVAEGIAEGSTNEEIADALAYRHAP